ncbi:ketopantoate reductase family protein [Virgibacillus salexigens]|uniref:ketopantoate reductase family protein n=1 Tax=Virgibacillus massiliensis TaxID=1462526 RepID=UPI001368C051|nr:2-dehydropantoate 2-reductase [Virgibacillus massiliensis]MYL42755.1 2-dehydropantoate 2-reductase [Virgibacillus massiliensis]
MKILILGAGAMGSLFAGKLTKCGFDVTLYNRPNNHVEIMKQQGVQMVHEKGDFATLHVPVYTNPADLSGDYELMLVLIKSFATKAVLEKVLPMVDDKTPILTLQNGIGNLELIQQLAPTHEVFVGGTSAGAGWVKQGVIEQRAWGKTFIGSTKPTNENVDFLKKVAATFSESGLETLVSDNVQSIIWSKLVVNIAYNGLTAVTRLKNGEAIEYKEGKELVSKLVEEAVEVAHAKEISLLYKDPVQECIRLGIEEIGRNISSMLTDVLHQRKTEIEVINGAIVKEGKRLQIATPYNNMMYKLVKMIDQSYPRTILHP